MKTRLAFFSIALLSTIYIQSEPFLTVDKALWYGTIKFPTDIKIVPPVRIYYAGNKIPSETDNEGHQVSFAISEHKIRNSFYLIIVDRLDIFFECKLIQYLRVPEGRPYKFYVLSFKPNKELDSKLQEVDISEKGSWDIVQKRLPDDLRIPDDAIIVCYHPHLVKNIEGGNALELPKIVLDAELLNTLTPQELHDASIQFLLSSLNLNSIHATLDIQVKPDFARKTIISLTA